MTNSNLVWLPGQIIERRRCPFRILWPSKNPSPLTVLLRPLTFRCHRIFSLYRHHLDLLKVPFPFVETEYFSLSDDKRIEALQTIFAQCEKDPKVISLVSNLSNISSGVSTCGTKLAHAKSYPIFFFGKKPGYWHLTKRSAKRTLIDGTCRSNYRRCAIWQIRLHSAPSTALACNLFAVEISPDPNDQVSIKNMRMSPCPGYCRYRSR